MSEYFVAGGVYKDYQGKERFVLMAPTRKEPPYLMINGFTPYFGLLGHKAHIYRVEEDYTLSLVAPSVTALEWGVKAPEKVALCRKVLKKLQTAVKNL
ncbi:MAG: hypothetical protein WAU47_08240 [Desulfobaccales bacterium]